MEYLEGCTLDQAGLTGIAELLEVFTDVAAALHAMHQAGFVHADIKPNNIMLCNGQGVKIFDLGQSCGLGSVKERIQGTPDFIAPEQVMKLPMSERTDVFNLGATMYWCLTGKFFPTRIRGQQKAGAFDIGLARDAETPQELNSQVPTVLSNLVMECCCNGAANRPAMSQVLDGFKAVSHALKIVGE
jgi:serine/threonine-protein kinase